MNANPNPPNENQELDPVDFGLDLSDREAQQLDVLRIAEFVAVRLTNEAKEAFVDAMEVLGGNDFKDRASREDRIDDLQLDRDTSMDIPFPFEIGRKVKPQNLGKRMALANRPDAQWNYLVDRLKKTLKSTSWYALKEHKGLPSLAFKLKCFIGIEAQLGQPPVDGRPHPLAHGSSAGTPEVIQDALANQQIIEEDVVNIHRNVAECIRGAGRR